MSIARPVVRHMCWLLSHHNRKRGTPAAILHQTEFFVDMDDRLTQWTLTHALVMLAACAAGMVFSHVWPAVIFMSVSVMVVCVSRMHDGRPALTGIANRVTLGRLVLLYAALLSYSSIGTWLFLILTTTVMVLDGVDGYIARRLGEVSRFGEVFDMEVDAFFALGISLCIWIDHPVAWWMMPAAVLRYVFVILYHLLGWHMRQRPSMPEAKLIGVLYFISLLTPVIFGWSRAWWVVAIGCILVTMSFVRECALMARSSDQ